MNNQTESMQHADVSSEVVAKPGTLLRQKRESLQLSQQQIADKLRLRVTLVQSIEENNFNIDKVKTFTRGYVRSYARVVGIEESVILASYDTHYGSAGPDVEMVSFSKRTKREQHNSRINYLTFGIILIVIGISSVWWYQNQEKDTLATESALMETSSAQAETEGDGFATVSDLLGDESTQQTETTPSDEISADESTTDGVFEEDSAAIQTEEDQAVVEASDTVAIAEEVQAVVSEPQVVQEQSASSSIISMNFQADCWIQVKDATGKTLSVGLKKAGQSLSLDGTAPFRVILGAPENVSITFASEPVDLSRYTSGKVARFTLSR